MSLKYETAAGTTHEAVMVHKTNEPGSLVIDRMTGIILTPNEGRPDWAEGLAVAILSEHRQFYTSRLGTYTAPELYALEDLSWLAVDEAGDAVELDADSEYRMDAIAEHLGVIREDGLIDVEHAMGEVEMGLDHTRNAEDVKALEDAQAAGFGELRTGTQ